MSKLNSKNIIYKELLLCENNNLFVNTTKISRGQYNALNLISCIIYKQFSMSNIIKKWHVFLSEYSFRCSTHVTSDQLLCVNKKNLLPFFAPPCLVHRKGVHANRGLTLARSDGWNNPRRRKRLNDYYVQRIINTQNGILFFSQY